MKRKPVLSGSFPFERVNELILLFKKVVNENSIIYRDELNALKESQEVKEELADYVIIGNLEGKTCYPIALTNNVPEWLEGFLMDCYVLVHNSLVAKDKAAHQ